MMPNKFSYIFSLLILGFSLIWWGGSSVSASYTPFSNLSANLSYPNPAKFYFNYNNYSGGNFVVDISTYSDMSWDVYKNYGSGLSSPVTVHDSNRWDKYSCGKTLYWRVYNTHTNYSSPIQRATVQCGGGYSNNQFSNMSAYTTRNYAQFNFNYSGYSNNYSIDISTYPDMSWDTYINFVSGNSTQLSLHNPNHRWDKFNSCNRYLYWRVWNQDKSVVSPIRATYVSC